MGKKKTVEAYKDVKELNWEGEKSEFRIQNSEIGDQDTGIEGVPGSWGVLEQLALHLEKVDPEVRKDNPVWHWALCDDHCTFIFKDGRKATIKI